MFKTYAEQALIHFVWCRDQGFSLKHMCRDLADRGYSSPSGNPVNKAVSYGIGRGAHEVPPETMEIIAKAILSEYKVGSFDGDLVDRMAEVLKAPFYRNVLNGQTFTSLQKALLVPDEMIGLSERLKKKEYVCGGCGNELKEGEMCSIATTSAGSAIFCIFCQHPDYIPCMNCRGKEKVGLGDRIKFLFSSSKGSKCEKCGGGKKEKKEEGVEGAEVLIGGAGGFAIPVPDFQVDQVAGNPFPNPNPHNVRDNANNAAIGRRLQRAANRMRPANHYQGLPPVLQPAQPLYALDPPIPHDPFIEEQFFPEDDEVGDDAA